MPHTSCLMSGGRACEILCSYLSMESIPEQQPGHNENPEIPENPETADDPPPRVENTEDVIADILLSMAFGF